MSKHSITVSKKARYYQIGEASPIIKKVWIVLHGYAMLSEFFIKKFENLNDGSTLIIAPEALNRFYIDGTYNRVGASWMTKEERITDIKENNEYLNSLAKEIFNQIGHDNFSLNILGFSQGGATACRWAFSSDMKVNNLILWAGDIPGDTLTVENKEKWASINTHLIMGNQDYLIPEEMKVKFLEEIQNYGIDFSSTKYEGGHKIYPEVLLKFSKSL
jgi:predicted esterase